MRLSHLLGRAAAAALIASWTCACGTGGSLFSLDKSGNSAKAQAAVNDKKADPGQMKTLAENLDTELQSAKDARSHGDAAGAIQTLSQLMLVAPDDGRVVGEYGKALVAQGRSAEAVQFLKRGTELSPGDWSIYSALGVAYDQQNDYANAKVAYTRALQLKPGEGAVLNNFAMSRMLAGDIAGANDLIAKAQATGSADPKIAHNLSLMTGLKAAAISGKAPTASPAGMTVKQTVKGPALVQALPKKTHIASPAPAQTASAASAPLRQLAAKTKPTEAKKTDATPALRTAAD